jgi:hypothetical protein
MEPANESLSVLAAEPVAVAEPAGESAAAIPAAGPAAEMEPATDSAAVQGRSVLVDGPAAAQGGCWVMNSAISPKVMVKMAREGSAVKAAGKAATPQERQSGEFLSELECTPAVRRAAAKSVTPPPWAAPEPAMPAAAAQGKRKANAGGAGGSQKRKRSSPAKLKDLQ